MKKNVKEQRTKMEPVIAQNRVTNSDGAITVAPENVVKNKLYKTMLK